MTLQDVKKRLESKAILFSEEQIHGKPTVIGYDKRFKLIWFATQLNTFITASEFGDETITVPTIEGVLNESFKYAQDNYNGWPRGLQSGLGVISVLISKNITEDAMKYCRELKSGKKWAAFTIPVTIDSSSNRVYSFDKNPIWGRIYYPYFRKLIDELTR